jgi:ubiquinone biosynthesis protein
MAMWETLGTVRDLGRLQEIASVLVRFGFGDLVRRIGLADVLERAGKLLHLRSSEQHARLSTAQRVRLALEALGPTFIKLGQVLATRVDLFPPEWITEFSRLQSDVPALPWSEIEGPLSAALGQAPESAFAAVEQVPMAAGSLAQAHRAWLQDGTPVVLKVRRPGIGDVVEADLRLLARLADIVDTRIPDLARYHLPEVVAQFATSLRRELDFVAECRSAERIAANFAGHPGLVIPQVYWQWTRASVAVQEFIDGLPGSDLAAVDAAGLDRARLAREGAGIVLKMVLEDGLFHADPHPGNLFFLRDGRLALIDFGMVGRLSEQRRGEVAVLLHGLAQQRPSAVSEVLLDWAGGVEVDETALMQDIASLVDTYRGVALKDLRVGSMLGEITGLLRQYGLTLPPDLALMIKTFLTLDGVGRQLDPDFDMTAVAGPFLERAIARQYTPSALWRRGRDQTDNWLDLAGTLPRDARQILQATRRGRLQLRIETRAMDRFGEQVQRAANRLVVGLITAALVVGSSIVMHSVGSHSSGWLLALGVAGFISAAMCGVWIVYSIWRSGK